MAEKTRLVLEKAGPYALSLGLRSGDVLLAVDGHAFDGGPAELALQFMPAQRRRALTFDRQGRRRTLLCNTHRLGQWTRLDLDLGQGETVETPGPLDRLRNWEVYRGPDDDYDAQPSGRPLLALIAPPLWLVQMRLWASLVAWGGMMAMAVPAGWTALVVVQLLSGLYFWRMGPALFRSDRLARGLRPFAILAAADEQALDQAVRGIEPRLRSVYTSRRVHERLAAMS